MDRLRGLHAINARPGQARLPLLVILAMLVSACASTPPTTTPSSAPSSTPSRVPAPEASQPPLQAAAGERRFTIDPIESAVHVYAFSAGRAGALGHNHVIAAPQLKGQVLLNERALVQSRFALDLRLDELLLDPPDLRAQLGGGFSTPLSPQAIAATREHMLGEENLQAASFPFLQVRSLQIVGAEPKFAAQIEVQLHGQRKTQWLALNLHRQDARLSASGALVLRQSDFGIKPYSVLGGLLAVADELVVEFDLVAKADAIKPSDAAAKAD